MAIVVATEPEPWSSETANAAAGPTAARSGFRERQREKLQRSLLAALASELEPGEEVQAWVLAQVRPRRFLRLELVAGAFSVFAIRTYYLVVTERRMFTLRVPKLGGELSLETVEPLDGLVIERWRRGPLSLRVVLRRRHDGELLRFRIPGIMRSQAEQVFGSLARAAQAPVS